MKPLSLRTPGALQSIVPAIADTMASIIYTLFKLFVIHLHINESIGWRAPSLTMASQYHHNSLPSNLHSHKWPRTNIPTLVFDEHKSIIKK